MIKRTADIKEFLKNKKNLSFCMVILFFALYLVIGLSVYRDYGISYDELIQRDHSLVNYKYVNSKILNREIEYLSGEEDLPEYEHKYYGVAMQMPMVFVEDVFHFQLSTRHIILIRHLYNFLICVLGYICFYFFLKKTFLSRQLALFGVAFISLYPRFFAYQFYDVKNILFVALNMITLLALVRVVEKCSFLNILVFSFIAALTTNLRIMGVIFPVILIGYFIVTDLTKKDAFLFRNFVSGLGKYLLIIVLYICCWFIITPAAWEEPVQTFKEIFIYFSHYDKWNGTMLFNGKPITCEERPWYYLFVWFGISIPLLYLLLFITGHVYTVVSIVKSKDKWNDILGKYKWLMCSLLLFWGSVGAVIISNSRIYGEWRHMYFVFVPFCCIALYGFRYLLEVVNKKIVYSVVIICLFLQVLWMVWNHPHQYVYFNSLGKQFASNFDRDTWRVSNAESLFWILNHDDDPEITISANSASLKVVQALLNEDEKSRLQLRKEDAKYIIEGYDSRAGNTVEYEGYAEVYTIWVDNFKISSVFKKIE